jgi:hypothetical protein
MGPQKARLYDTLEKLVPRFEEMEQVLSSYSSEEKQKIIGEVIIHAISSPDPIRSMNGELDAIRKGSSVHRMINCAALSLEVPPTAAKEMLASLTQPTTCSQGFTRKYGADTHIRNLHSGLAKKVHLIDYIIGRLSDKYSPADPSLFRRKKNDKTIHLVMIIVPIITNSSSDPLQMIGPTC